MSGNAVIKKILVYVADEHQEAAYRYLVSKGRSPSKRALSELLNSWAREGLDQWADGVNDIIDGPEVCRG